MKRRFFDWRLVLSISLLALVTWQIVGSIQAHREVAIKDAQINALIDGRRTADAAAARQSAEAARERASLAEDLHEVLAYVRVLDKRQQAQGALLRQYHVPDAMQLFTTITPPAIVVTSTPKAKKPAAKRVAPVKPGKGRGRGHKK